MRAGILKRAAAAVAAVTFIFTSVFTGVAGSEVTANAATVSIPVKASFNRSDARSILDMINEMRTGSDAWYYNQDGSKYSCSGLGELSWDEGLEQAAMQRAAEIAVSYDHSRPNGESCFSIESGSL